jgi:hypothetical protein
MKIKILWLPGWLPALLLFSSASNGYAQWAEWGELELPRGVRPYITVQEQYNSNINLTPTNPQKDWITMVSPGVRGSLGDPKDPQWGFDVDAMLGLNYYANNSNDNYISTSGRLNTWYTFDRRLTLRLNEYILRSEEPREASYAPGALPGQYVLATQQGRSPYFRNVLSPSADYQYGREHHFFLTYTNNIYQTQNPGSENSQSNDINPRLEYWLDIHNGITLEYGLLKGDFQTSPDLLGQMAHGRYTYRFNPRTSIFADYTFLHREFQSPGVNYDVYSPNAGISHAFTSSLRGTAQMGYFWQTQAEGQGTTGYSFDVNLTQITPKASFSLSAQGGYTEDYFSSQNLVFTKYFRGLGVIRYRLTEKSNLNFIGSLERILYSSSNQKDWVYGLNASYSYLLLRWLTLGAEVSRREDDSNLSNTGYLEYRAMIRLIATYF